MADDARASASKQLLLAAQTDNVELAESILDADPPIAYDINFTDGIGNTALHYACENISADVLDRLLNEEVDVDVQNTLAGDTPLHVACRVANEEARNWLVSELLEAGAPTETKNHAGLRAVDTIVGAKADTELGKKLIDMLTVTRAEAQLGADDIAYDDDDIADDGPPSDVEA
ncbi:hypothetical protein MVES1_000308 [Malassezia vespertilionis]|uniref:uncharacterized protein n=1 Tax=Malassezia vespertilionis TaxID=2020962 RepID=UPI0024B0E07F|nr:uncharacterized protein MVES1_000308 [Malassezia vespertilionis]WFD04983.1 hypothetical protein MVES1_000308 [Malassezia vespertilionis]